MVEKQKKETSEMAIASFVFGLLIWIYFLGMIFGFIAIILGIISLAKISKNKDNLKGAGFAKAGILLGIIGITLFLMNCFLAASFRR